MNQESKRLSDCPADRLAQCRGHTVQARYDALQGLLNKADQRLDDLEGALGTCERWFAKHSPIAPLIGGFGDAEHPMLTFIRAHQSAPAAKVNPVDGDVLPPVGSKVWIELASSGWDEQTVTGYYVWPSHGLDKNVHRVFVRVKDADGTPNARLLADVRTSAQATSQ